MSNPGERDEITLLKIKRSFIRSVMQRSFEDRMYDILGRKKFNTLDEMDAFVEKELVQYLYECDLVDQFYDEKIYE